MVTVNNLVDKYNWESTDNKPTDGVRNGSEGREIDTGKLYVFDAESATWIEQPEYGGGFVW